VFAAIVDGDHGASPIYDGLSELIFGWVSAECPGYARCGLGDARTRNRQELVRLVDEHLPGAEVEVQPSVVRLTSDPSTLTRESVGFYYASFVLPVEAYARMLREVEAFFEEHGEFAMPINRLVVRR
jgi:hypothetical protein